MKNLITDIEKLDVLLMDFARDADKILREELERFKVKYEHARVRVYNIRSVGVQGDQRTYGYPVEVEIAYDGKFVWDQEEFIRTLSNRITNEVPKRIFCGEKMLINKVLYILKGK